MTEPHKTPHAHILVVDDEPDLRTVYELTLLREGYRVDAAGTVTQARQLLAETRFDAVITDMRLPDGLGMDILKDLAAQHRPERCVVMTAYGSADNAVEALKAGAFDYLTKPVDLRQFRSVVAQAVQGASKGQPVASATPAIGVAAKEPMRESTRAAGTGGFGVECLVGESSGIRAVRERIVKVARSMAPVLVRGESGSGKELVARAVHGCSHRSSGPFVAVNCGAIPDNLIEAEFFGAKKGSYTGSVQDRDGYFQAASGGTLFLDEIGDLPLAMQSKLLRVIQERKVRPLGSTVEVALDVRVVSATHKDIAAQVLLGTFRQDLYYRLNVIDIVVPPLRERRSDLPLLCAALLKKIALDSGMPIPLVEPSFYDRLHAHPLQGNVRELENLLHRALALSEGSVLTGAEVGDSLPAPPAPPEAASAEVPAPSPVPAQVGPALQAPLGVIDLQVYLDDQERQVLHTTLRATQFNRTAAAQLLGLTLRQIRYRMQRLGVTVPGADEPSDETAHGR